MGVETQQDGMVEDYPGQSDEIPVFVPRGTVAREAPEWLRSADPDWYRSATFDDWYGAPATTMPEVVDRSGVWEYLGSVEWEMRDGCSMTVSEGKVLAGRIGARYVTWDDLEYAWGRWTDNAEAADFLRQWADPEFLNYALDIPGEPGEYCWPDAEDEIDEDEDDEDDEDEDDDEDDASGSGDPFRGGA